MHICFMNSRTLLHQENINKFEIAIALVLIKLQFFCSLNVLQSDEMSDEKKPSVFIKVALYLFDLGRDWVNGGLMLHMVDPVDTVNSLPNSTIEGWLNETGGPHIAWGIMTIGMSWIPPVFAIAINVFRLPHIEKWFLVKFVLWPILVPIHM